MVTTTVNGAQFSDTSLGLKTPSVLSAHGRIMKGFPFAALTRFGHQTGLSTTEIADLIHLPVRTLARRKAAGRLRWDESERLLRLARVYESAVELFNGNRDDADRWLRESLPALGGHPPLELVVTEAGAQAVETLIGQLEHGVFV